MIVQSLVGGTLKFRISGTTILMSADEVRDLSIDFTREELHASVTLNRLVSRGFLKLLQQPGAPEADWPTTVIIVVPELGAGSQEDDTFLKKQIHSIDPPGELPQTAVGGCGSL